MRDRLMCGLSGILFGLILGVSLTLVDWLTSDAVTLNRALAQVGMSSLVGFVLSFSTRWNWLQNNNQTDRPAK